MSSEYNKLYSFLEDLIKNKTDNETLVAVIPDEIEHAPKKRGRPPGSKTKMIRCQGCMEKYHIDSIDDHYDTSIACKKFTDMKEKPPIVAYPLHQLIITALEQSTIVDHACRFCEIQIEDIKLHLTQSQVCNRLAYATFKKTI